MRRGCVLRRPRGVRGLEEFPEDDWPDNIELLYYSFHVMVGLGTLFIAVMGGAALLGLLAIRPDHGYELHQRLSNDLGQVWHISLSQTYLSDRHYIVA